MEVKERATDIDLPSELSTLLKGKQAELLRVVNGALIMMFWQIGKTITDYAKNNHKVASVKGVIRAISERLVVKYGPFLSVENLQRMIEFNTAFPEFLHVQYISSVVGWEQMAVLSRQKNEAARMFYLQAVVENGLTAPALKRHIAAKAFEASQVEQHNHGLRKKSKAHILNTTLDDKYFIKLIEAGLKQELVGRSAILNLFKQPQLSSFKSLMAASKKLTSSKKRNIPNFHVELNQNISQLIYAFRQAQNNRLNANLNMLFWEVGKLINERSLSENEHTSKTTFIAPVSRLLAKQFGKSFNPNKLLQMCRFNEEFQDFKIATRVAYLLPFEYIVVLLNVQTIEAKLFYARRAAEAGLSLSAFQKIIDYNEFFQTPGAKEREQHLMAQMNNPIIETSISKTDNSEMEIVSEYVDFGDDIDKSLLVTNVFKNKHFIAFIDSF